MIDSGEALLAALPLAAALVTPERAAGGRIADCLVISVNAPGAALMGRPPEALRGRKLRDLCPGLAGCGPFDELVRVIETRRPARFERLSKFGRHGAIDMRAAPFDGGAVIIFGEVDAQVAELAQRLELAMETARIGVWEFWPREDRVLWTREECAIMGVEASGLSNTSADFVARLAPESGDMLDAAIVAMARGDVYANTGRIIRPDGVARWVREHSRVIERDAEGAALHVLGVTQDVTEQHEALLRAEEAERRLDMAVTAGGIGVWELWPEERQARWSATKCRVLGLDPDLFADRVLGLDGLPIGGKAEFMRKMRAALADEDEMRDISPAFRSDGARRWILAHARVVARDAQGAPLHILGVSQDVTDEKEAQLRVERAETRLREAIDAMPFGFVLYEADGRLAMCNEQYRALSPKAGDAMIVGANYEDILRASIENGEYPDLEGPAEDWIADKLRRLTESSDIIERRAGDRWVRCISARSEAGDHVGFRVDLTELKRHERALEEAAEEIAARERELNGFFDLALDLLGIASTDGLFVKLNASWGALLGHPVEALIGRSFLDFVHPDDIEATRREVARLEAGQRVIDFTNRYRRADGGWVWIEWRGAPGPRDLIYFAARDVTSRMAELARREAQAAQEAVLSESMALALKPTDTQTFLGAVLDLLIARTPWLQLLDQAGIFLVDDAAPAPDCLRLAASHNLESEIETLCAQVKFGQCLCGRAAQQRATQHDDALGPSHELRHDGMSPHGHYNVPILDGDRTLGVLMVYLPEGHARDEAEIAFLERIAGVLALGLNQRRLMAEAEAARRRAEDALAELSTYQVALDAHAIISVTDPDGVIIAMNSRFCEISGYSEAELLGGTHRIVNSGVHPQEHWERVWGAIKSGVAWHGEVCSRSKSGALYWADTTIIPVRDASGAIRRHVAIRFDITDRVRMARALEETNAHLGQVAEISGAGGWELDLAAYTLRWDAITRAIHEVDDEFEPDPLSAIGFYTPEARPVMQAAALACWERGEAFDLELPMRTATGRDIWVRAIGRPVGEGGRVVRVAGVVQDVTDRKRREIEAARLQARFEAIFQNTEAIIFLKRRDGSFLIGNQRFLEQLGVDDIEGRSDHDFMPAEMADELAAAEAEIFETGRPRVMEDTVLRPDGQIRHYASSKFLIPDPALGEDLLCVIGADITERKRRESEIERLHARFRAIFDNTEAVIFLKRRDGTYVAANRHFVANIGLDDVEGLTNADIFPADVAARQDASEQEVFRTGEPFSGEETLRLPSGRVQYYVTSKFLVPDFETGEMLLCGVASDITAQRLREQENAQLRARFEAIFENSDSAISLRTSDNRVVAANERMLEAFGREAHDPQTDPDYAPEHVRQIIQASLERVFASGRKERVEETFPDHAGRLRTFLISRSLIADPIVGENLLCSIATDITEQKAMQASLEESRLEAERANAAKSRFLATMSHEIRTPMNGVIGMAALLEEKIGDPALAQMVGVIRESGDALMTLLNDILDFSKIEVGKLNLETAPFQPERLARRVADIHELKAREKGLRFTVKVGAAARGARLGDAHRVRQMLHNLLSNAIKFTETGEVALEIDAAGADDALRIVVSDTGLGMTPEQAERIFDEFAQADASTTRKYGGSGLGLSIVKGLCEAMDGALSVRTAPGEGARFELLLPLPRASAAAPAPSEPLVEASLPQGLRVLAADDSEINRIVLAAMLDALGVASDIAAGGLEAVERSRAGAYDLLMLDISMPDLDGVQTLAEIRGLEAERGAAPAPAIAVTAHALKTQGDEFIAAGFDAHLPKPLRRAELIATLRALAPTPPRG